MLLGFRRQFAPYVEDGSKTHTIRAIRKVQPRVGETCHYYVDPRQKTMRLLGRWPCVKVQSIVIDAHLAFGNPLLVKVLIDGSELSRDEREALAYRDGFRDGLMVRSKTLHFAKMIEFWNDRLAANPIWEGHLIHWRFVRKEAA